MEFIFPFIKSIVVISTFIASIDLTKYYCKKLGYSTLKQQYYLTSPATLVYCISVLIIISTFDIESYYQLVNLFCVESFFRLVVISLYSVLAIFFLYLGKFYFLYIGYDFIETEINFLFLIQKFYAPFIEEYLYRGILISFKVFDNLFYNGILSSFLFGLSHLRHLFDDYSDVNVSKNQIFFQVSFTTLFGIICSCFLSITRSIYSCIIAHILCNILGLPKILNIDSKENEIGKTLYIIGIIMFILTLIFGSFVI